MLTGSGTHLGARKNRIKKNFVHKGLSHCSVWMLCLRVILVRFVLAVVLLMGTHVPDKLTSVIARCVPTLNQPTFMHSNNKSHPKNQTNHYNYLNRRFSRNKMSNTHKIKRLFLLDVSCSACAAMNLSCRWYG